MTKILKEALAVLSKLPESEQNAIGAWLLEELTSGQRWERLFSESSDHLEGLANQALAEHRDGQTEELDANQL